MFGLPKQTKSGPPTLRFEARLFLMAVLVALPGVLLALIVLWVAPFSAALQWTLTIILLGVSYLFAYALRKHVLHPFQVAANLLAALREGDFSIKARAIHPDDAFGELMLEINSLRDTLREQRFGAREANTMLRTVMEVIDIAIFTFDNEQRLRQVNRAGERLLANRAEHLLGRSAGELGLAEGLQDEPDRTIERIFPGGMGRWRMRRTAFRQAGVRHQLLVLTDLSRTLRDEERQAWQRLVRVLGHELNNSIAPIKSIAVSLQMLLSRDPPAPDWRDDLRQGLEVISSRAESLARFMEAYARLARLPAPNRRQVHVEEWVRRVIQLETRKKVTLRCGPEMTIKADPDQLDQLLINLVCNAVDASSETGGCVEVGWDEKGDYLELVIQDEGPGLSGTSNLFVPFFTTKPKGTGIGLVLSRQIAEAHGGILRLQNRTSKQGCEATVRLPIN